MRRLRDLSIRGKLMAIIMITCSVALLLACAVFIRYDLYTFRQAKVYDLTSLADMIGSHSTAALTFNDADSARGILKALSAKPHIVAACIYARDGRVLACYLRGHPNGGFSPPPAENDDSRFEHNQLILFRKIMLDDERIGAIYLQSDLGDVRERLSRFTAVLLTVALGSLLVAFLLSSRLQRVISEPIRSLASATSQVTVDKNYSIRAVKYGEDELGLLIEGFNEMLEQIHRRDIELQHARDELEIRVEERTRELQEEIAEKMRVQVKLQKAKDAAEAGNRAKSEFLANMSHEIRTPLNGVVGMTDLALETELTPEQREYLETVKLSADSLLTVINDILDFSKIEAGKIDMEAVNFNLHDCLETTMKTLALRADEKGLELLCEVAPEVPEMVRGDSSRLRQIVVNLVGNAIKFTSQGEVALKVRFGGEDAQDRILQFEVSDTGIGIAPQNQKLIFDSFSQADSSTTRKYGGTGLGLTISTRLIEMMGGKIWVESDVGKGSHFHFTVRVGAVDTKVVEVGRIAPPEILRGVKALAVDDNRTNRRILEGMLKRWEMKPTSVEGGEEALAELSAAYKAQTPYGLILLDMHMPKMDGFTLVERIRQMPELSAAIVVMLTSAGHRGDAARCRELGISAYLLKPIRQSELREAIARVLGAAEQKGAIPLITRYSLHDARDPATVLRVLLAEDNLVNQRLVVRLLEKRGHRVAVAANGREALQALGKESFDLVLMDVQMPEMDGLEATAALRKNEKETGSGRHQPVIALTAHAMKGDYERCMAAGMDGYLAKPIRPQELDEMLEKCLAQRMETANVSEGATPGE
jgi:two-component system, sensor histidine kinase and response regulator